MSISDIKVYVTMRGSNVKEFLISAAEHLLRRCESGFIFKVSKVERDGTICFFVRRHDFFLLEEFVKTRIDELRKGNPFIAHRNLIGISRDLMMDSLDSLLGKEITDDSLLLNDDDEIWHILGHSRCWDDVNKAFQRKNRKC